MGDLQQRPVGPRQAYPDYDQDLVAWALANADLLRNGRLSEIDAAHLAEELEDLGKSERRALCSHIRVLLLHLLKWQFQPGLRGPSWRLSIENARREIQVILEDSPSLSAATQVCLDKEYPTARRSAVIETGLAEDRFPASSPYTVAQVLDEDFWTYG
jgi:Domain of unknown function DUF29